MDSALKIKQNSIIDIKLKPIKESELIEVINSLK